MTTNPLPSDAAVQIPGKEGERLHLNFAGKVIEHLGIKMYAGRPVPAVAELVSNAWDADAEEVDVKIPLDSPWVGDESQVVVVRDSGHGMDWEMVRRGYLIVGRDRRATSGERSMGGRLVQGRKGVGKLAGFGIADVVEVQTVTKWTDQALGDQSAIWFRMDWEHLKNAQGEGPVQILYAGSLRGAPAEMRKEHGTTVTLRRLKHRNAINSTQFNWSLARRFELREGFRVTLNGESLIEEPVDFALRYPAEPGKWASESIANCGPVEYWIGFTDKPRQENKAEQAGLLVYTRGKVAQEATLFRISGGVHGQHGLRYVIGKVKAPWLDENDSTPDYVSTSRGEIAWETDAGQAFMEWGQGLLKEQLRKWLASRTQKKSQRVLNDPKLNARISRLDADLQRVANDFILRFAELEGDDIESEGIDVADEYAELVATFLDALENQTLRRVIEKLSAAPEGDLEELDELLSTMELRVAVGLLQVIRGNLAAIDALEKMNIEDASERDLISKHLKKNPWLIDPTWILNRPEAEVEKWIKDEFDLDAKHDPDNKDRVDFFCVGAGGTLHIVEIKRGRHKAKNVDSLQADKYRTQVLKAFDDQTIHSLNSYSRVVSHLVCDRLHDEAISLKESHEQTGKVYFHQWKHLTRDARLAHQQFISILEEAKEAAAEAAENSNDAEE